MTEESVMTDFGYCIFIPEGGHTLTAIKMPAKYPDIKWVREALGLGDVCMGFMPFGTPELPMYAVHDDEFLLKKKIPVGTVVITGVVLCSNILIVKVDKREGDITGFTAKEMQFVMTRLKLAKGQILRPPTDNDMCVESIENFDDLMGKLDAGARANMKANKSEWGDDE